MFLFYRLAVFGLLGLPCVAAAQSTWQIDGGAALFSAPSSWNVMPASGIGTSLIFHGDVPTIAEQDYASFTLSNLTLASGSKDFTIRGGPLVFAASTGQATIRTSTTGGRLNIENPITFLTPTRLNAAAGNDLGSALWLRGTLTSQTDLRFANDFIENVMITSANNTGMGGTVSVESNTLLFLCGPNAMWRTTDLSVSGLSVIANINPPAPNYEYPGPQSNGTIITGPYGPGYHQQYGNISGSGQISVGSTYVPATVLSGFLNSDGELEHSGGLHGYHGKSHFGKVGTGRLRITGDTRSVQMSISIRDGTFEIGGTDGTVIPQEYLAFSPGEHTLYGSGQLRINNDQLFAFNNEPQGRIGDSVPWRAAGGSFRIDGHAATLVMEKAGRLRPYAGQSHIVANSAGAALTMQFASADSTTLNRGGQVGFVASTGTVKFTSAAATVWGVIPWALAQTNYTNDPTSPTNTFAVNSLAMLNANNAVVPISTYVLDDFTQASANVRMTTSQSPAASVLANSLTIDGGTLTLATPLTLTRGALINRAAGSSIDGAGITTSGRLYLNATQTLTINAPLSGTGLSKGAAGTIVVNGIASFGANPLVSVNAGRLEFGPNGSVNGTVTWQVPRGGTLANIPGPVNGMLRGEGTVDGPVTIATGGVIMGSALASGLAGGDSPGTLNLTGTLTLQPGAIIRVNMSSVFGGQYTHSSLAGNVLDLSQVTAANPVILQPQSLELSNEAYGPLYDQISGTVYELSFGNFPGGVIGFDPAKFRVDTSRYVGTLNSEITFTQTSTGLVMGFRPLSATPVPEPAWLALGLLFLRRR